MTEPSLLAIQEAATSFNESYSIRTDIRYFAIAPSMIPIQKVASIFYCCCIPCNRAQYWICSFFHLLSRESDGPWSVLWRKNSFGNSNIDFFRVCFSTIVICATFELCVFPWQFLQHPVFGRGQE